MESLPVEILDMIVRQLTPVDLAHCSAVSCSWYEIMNQDWIWASYCDPDQEAALRTVPNVLTPNFKIQETGTLSPICRWKMAFLREKQLWKNWGQAEMKKVRKMDILKNDKNDEIVLNVDFFTDTLVVVWHSNKIEILDVSTMPANIAAKSDNTIRLERDNNLKVVGNNLLLAVKEKSVEVFIVNIPGKNIKMKHNVTFDGSIYGQVAKEALFFFDDTKGKKLKILSLNCGVILKEEAYPSEVNTTDDKTYSVGGIITSPTSDLVVVAFKLNVVCYQKIFIYSLKQHTFLLCLDKSCFQFELALHGDWIALSRDFFPPLRLISKSRDFALFNFSETSATVLSGGIMKSTPRDKVSANAIEFIEVCNGNFVLYMGNDSGKHEVRIISPSSKSLFVLGGITSSGIDELDVINNKVILLRDHLYGLAKMWKPLKRSLVECALPKDFCECFSDSCKFNQSFTKVINQVLWEPSRHTYSWYIKHLW